MCKQCLVLGALLNAGGRVRNKVFETKFLSRYDKKEKDWNDYAVYLSALALDVKVNSGGCGYWQNAFITSVNKDSTFDIEYENGGLEKNVPQEFLSRLGWDDSAKHYLRATFSLFRKHGIEFAPLLVDSDGSCLPHSLSKGLAGMEIYFDALRADLVIELTENEDWYRDNLPEAQVYFYDDKFDDEEWARFWHREIVAAAEPTKGQLVGPNQWLEGIHILGFANLLRRPILLLDTPEKMSTYPEEMSLNDQRGGMYLPLRHSRHDILANNSGKCPSPLVIGWQSASNTHYIAVVGFEYSEATIREEFLNWAEEADSPGAELTAVINDYTSRGVLTAVQSTFLLRFFIENIPSARLAGIQSLVMHLKAISECISDPSKDRSKFGIIKLNRPTVLSNIVATAHTLDLLRDLGFYEDFVDESYVEELAAAAVGGGAAAGAAPGGGEEEAPVGRCLRYDFLPHGPAEEVYTNDKSKIDATVQILELMQTEPLRHAAFKGKHEVNTSAAEALLFGPRPKLLLRSQLAEIDMKLALLAEERRKHGLSDGTAGTGEGQGLERGGEGAEAGSAPALGGGGSSETDTETLWRRTVRSELEWELARGLYGAGEDPNEIGRGWVFGSGGNAIELTNEVFVTAARTFEAVTTEDWSTAKKVFFNNRSFRVTCPVCWGPSMVSSSSFDVDGFVSCPHCTSLLTCTEASKTMLMEKLVQDALRSVSSVWICPQNKCRTGNLSCFNVCNACGYDKCGGTGSAGSAAIATTAAGSAGASGAAASDGSQAAVAGLHDAAEKPLLKYLTWNCRSCNTENRMTEKQCADCLRPRETHQLLLYGVKKKAVTPRDIHTSTAHVAPTALTAAAATSSVDATDAVTSSQKSISSAAAAAAISEVVGAGQATVSDTSDDTVWTCLWCTYNENSSFFNYCDMCSNKRGSMPTHLGSKDADESDSTEPSPTDTEPHVHIPIDSTSKVDTAATISTPSYSYPTSASIAAPESASESAPMGPPEADETTTLPTEDNATTSPREGEDSSLRLYMTAVAPAGYKRSYPRIAQPQPQPAVSDIHALLLPRSPPTKRVRQLFGGSVSFTATTLSISSSSADDSDLTPSLSAPLVKQLSTPVTTEETESARQGLSAEVVAIEHQWQQRRQAMVDVFRGFMHGHGHGL